LTDNKNRTASDIRIATNKRGGSIGAQGSVSFNFDRKGVIRVLSENGEEDALFELVSDAGAEDFEVLEDAFMITTEPSGMFAVKDALDGNDIPTEVVELQMVPHTLMDVDQKVAESNEALIEWLEDLDDVDAVYHNMNYLD
jgi:YebC/PmpR family DNA-binding regulatory protein